MASSSSSILMISVQQACDAAANAANDLKQFKWGQISSKAGCKALVWQPSANCSFGMEPQWQRVAA